MLIVCLAPLFFIPLSMTSSFVIFKLINVPSGDDDGLSIVTTLTLAVTLSMTATLTEFTYAQEPMHDCNLAHNTLEGLLSDTVGAKNEGRCMIPLSASCDAQARRQGHPLPRYVI